jgi:hypothetical protein
MNTGFRLLLAAFLLAMLAPLTASANPTLLAEDLEGASGSAIGPGGALYVTEGAAGRLTRIDPQTGAKTIVASGLPPSNPAIGVGGAMDVAFIGNKAYVLVTLVGSDVGGTDIVGIYRVDGPTTFTVIADIGAFSIANPPSGFPFFVPSGVHYAMEVFRGGLLVTDGHHNRVLWITLDGEISEFMTFGNTVPTGLEVHGNTVYMAEAGPAPHAPDDGKVVSFGPKSTTATEVASGAPLLVDVKFGRGRKLYALAQGEWDGVAEGSPASPETGSLLEVNANGSMTMLVDGLNIPTSFQFIGNTAYIVTLLGEVWKLDNVSAPPFGN